MLHVGQAGYEAFLAKELAKPLARGAGWVRSEDSPADLCFAHYTLRSERALKGDTGRQLAQALTDFFLETSREEVYDGEWPLVIEGERKRAGIVEEHFRDFAKKRMARVLKLAKSGRPAAGVHRGLFAFLSDQSTLHASRDGVFFGQRRMADDPQAPSRSFLKVEEAYAVLGVSPKEGETVVDLGAAPGGWSYSAAKRGAKVVAVDNGPMKAGGLHPNITHRMEDAFLFSGSADWLFCDMVEDPDRVLQLISGWLSNRRCRRFVVNLKFGRLDPLPLLRRARAALSPKCATLTLRHLYHDREEFTMVGESA